METIAELHRIPIKNIFYMLLYAWDKMEERDIVSVSGIDSTRLMDLFARILIGGMRHLKRRGLDRGYISHTEEYRGIKGKIDFDTSLKTQVLLKGRTYCNYDDLSYNILHNQIIKTTAHNLIKYEPLDPRNREDLLDMIRYFSQVDIIHLSHRIFGLVQLHSNNYFYDFLMKICELIFESFIPEKGPGMFKYRSFLEDKNKMNQVFENFVRNFYRFEQSEFNVRREEIPWALEPLSPDSARYIPKMQTDITLESSTRKIIIDTKFYGKTLQENYGKKTIHSGNLYQMFAYLKNQENTNGHSSHKCEGILLYPTVNEDLDLNYEILGHRFSIKTVNLYLEWPEIHNRLLEILDAQYHQT